MLDRSCTKSEKKLLQCTMFPGKMRHFMYFIMAKAQPRSEIETAIAATAAAATADTAPAAVAHFTNYVAFGSSCDRFVSVVVVVFCD